MSELNSVVNSTAMLPFYILIAVIIAIKVFKGDYIKARRNGYEGNSIFDRLAGIARQQDEPECDGEILQRECPACCSECIFYDYEDSERFVKHPRSKMRKHKCRKWNLDQKASHKACASGMCNNVRS